MYLSTIRMASDRHLWGFYIYYTRRYGVTGSVFRLIYVKLFELIVDINAIFVIILLSLIKTFAKSVE